MKSVLVVDDCEVEHMLIERLVSKLHIDVNLLCAFDGNQALELLKTIPEIDLILLDLNMPGMNGHEFLTVYSTQETWSIPVVIVSTSNHNRDLETCLQYNFVKNYIVKPMEIDQLSELLSA